MSATGATQEKLTATGTTEGKLVGAFEKLVAAVKKLVVATNFLTASTNFFYHRDRDTVFPDFVCDLGLGFGSDFEFSVAELTFLRPTKSKSLSRTSTRDS